MWNKIVETADFLRNKTNIRPAAGIVMGTGLGGLADDIRISDRIPYSGIPNFSTTTVEGHNGNLIFGELAGIPVAAMEGRFHYYEGYSMKELTFPLRVLKALGIRQIFISNAAGGINPAFSVGDLMLIRDHINFFSDNPLRGPNLDEMGRRFPDMSETYDKKLIDIACTIAEKKGIKLHRGVYVGNPGPSFETPAEYTHYRIIGGDAIGMSTIPEVIVARHMNLPVLAISVITNIAVAGHFTENSHEDVQKAANRASMNLSDLFREVLAQSPYSR
ncbi:MAG: purine-nucleoside phosphorylase [Bacteroidota bacterium]